MEHAKLANGSAHKPIGHSPTSAPKKAVRKKAESARPLRKETGSKSKSEKLVCRYCGSVSRRLTPMGRRPLLLVSKPRQYATQPHAGQK